MASQTLSQDPFTAESPPTSPQPPPNTPTRVLTSPGEAICAQPKTVSVSWPMQSSPNIDSLASSAPQTTFSKDVHIINSGYFRKGRFTLTPTWWKAYSQAPATVASTRIACDCTQFQTQRPQTLPPVPVVGEQVPEDTLSGSMVHKQRPVRRVSFLETPNVAEYCVPAENNLRPTKVYLAGE